MSAHKLPQLPQFDLDRSLTASEKIAAVADNLENRQLQRALRKAASDLLDDALRCSEPSASNGRRF